MEPVTRQEIFLAAAAGQEVQLPEPITREDKFLAAMAGMDVELPKPITRKDMFLAAVAAKIANGESGGGTGGVSKLPQVVDRSITEITAEDLQGVKKIGGWAFYSCGSLVSAEIPEGVTYIDLYSFHGCSALSTVIFPNSLNNISTSAFQNCTSLSSLSFGENLTNIGNQTFKGCTSLESVTLKSSTPPSLGSNAFAGCDNLNQIIVPAGTGDAYKSATNWSAYADIIVEGSAPAGGWTLSEFASDWDAENIYITNGFLGVYGDPHFLKDAQGNYIGDIDPNEEPAVEIDLSTLDKGTTYYVWNGVDAEYIAAKLSYVSE
jgi:hypothetical protein